LGIRPFFDEVLASAELGFEKPAREIFVEAASRLQLPSERILHVGDSVVDDFQGARAAGMRSVLVDREARDGSDEVISDLGSLLLFLKPGGGPAHGKPWEP
jgi:putative hydrolase of the HAD superfamily